MAKSKSENSQNASKNRGQKTVKHAQKQEDEPNKKRKGKTGEERTMNKLLKVSNKKGQNKAPSMKSLKLAVAPQSTNAPKKRSNTKVEVIDGVQDGDSSGGDTVVYVSGEQSEVPKRERSKSAKKRASRSSFVWQHAFKKMLSNEDKNLVCIFVKQAGGTNINIHAYVA
jgi:hypothetical protein